MMVRLQVTTAARAEGPASINSAAMVLSVQDFQAEVHGSPLQKEQEALPSQYSTAGLPQSGVK